MQGFAEFSFSYQTDFLFKFIAKDDREHLDVKIESALDNFNGHADFVRDQARPWHVLWRSETKSEQLVIAMKKGVATVVA